MKRTISFILAIVIALTLSITSFAASNDMRETKNPRNDKVVITISAEERDRQFNEAMEAIMEKLNGTAQTQDNIVHFQYEFFDYKYKTLKGYAGNQLPGGYRFPTGGGFYFSDSGGPSTSGSISLSLPAPFNIISFSVNLGQRSTSSGVFVVAPNTTDYFKLYVEKLMEIRPYAIYKQDRDTHQYYLYQVGAVTLTYSVSQYAKKV